MHEPYKPIKFHPSKIYSETRNWTATRIHNTLFHWVGRGHRGHAYLIENKRTSQGGPTGDERENRWESTVGYRRCMACEGRQGNFKTDPISLIVAVVSWLKYCRYGEKTLSNQSINQSIEIENFWTHVEQTMLRIKRSFFWYREKGAGSFI